MMTDNRTNEPTPEQVEAAAKALYEFETGLAEDSWGRAFEVERSLWRDEARAALEAATSERAAVPDAATERVTENSVRHVKRLTTELQNKREALNDQRREYRALLSKRDRTIDGLRAERDAALAAIERVKETLSLHNPNGRLVKEVLAAVDGAPEPEEKP